MSRSVVILLSVISVAVLGLNCGRPDNSRRIEKVVDVPSLIGRTTAEVTTTLGPPTTEDNGRLIWEFPRGELIVVTVFGNESHVRSMEFNAKLTDQQTSHDLGNYETLADLLGVNVRGKTPDNHTYDKGESVLFENLDLNGHPTSIGFHRVDGIFLNAGIEPLGVQP